MDMYQLDDALLEQVMSVMTQAGEHLLSCFARRSSMSVHQKDDGSPVSEADTGSSQLLCQGLATLLADTPVLSEEESCPDYELRKQWQRYWLIDPLDATRAFLQGSDEFSINVALIENDSPVLGVIYAPRLHTWYYAGSDQGSFQRSHDQKSSRLSASSINDHIDLLMSHHDMIANAQPDLTILPIPCHIHHVSSALKFGRIASGHAHAYLRIGPTCEWDTAAGQCIIEETGGQVIDMQGQPLRYNQKDSLNNPPFVVCSDPDYTDGIQSLGLDIIKKQEKKHVN